MTIGCTSGPFQQLLNSAEMEILERRSLCVCGGMHSTRATTRTSRLKRVCCRTGLPRFLLTDRAHRPTMMLQTIVDPGDGDDCRQVSTMKNNAIMNEK